MSSSAHHVLATLLAAVTLSSCTVAVDQRPVPERPQVCTFEHAPVCGQRGDQRQTFSNACLARAAGFRVSHRGACRIGAGPGFDRPGFNGPGVDRPRPDRPVACTREFAPVCAVRGSRYRTFDNNCLARADGFRPIHPGRCR